MLKYDEDSQNAKTLAIHYARQVGGNFLLDFMGGEVDITSHEQAVLIIDGFWEMTDLAVQDNSENKQIEEVADIEFWMYKLFIKINGYMTKHGFKELWDKAASER